MCRSRSATAARSSSHEANRPTSVAAVFAPIPGTPGSPSDGSPRSIAISAYAAPARAAGTPYLAATSGGPSVSPSPARGPRRSAAPGWGVPHDLHEVTVAADHRDRVDALGAHSVPITSSASWPSAPAVANPAAASTSMITGTCGGSPSGTTSGIPAGAVSGPPATRCAL